jgi:alkaline phosphatase
MMPPQSTGTGRRFFVDAVMVLGLVLGVVIVASRFAPWELTAGNLVLRAQRGSTIAFPTPEGEALISVAHRQTVIAEGEPRPRNVVLIIADGMGVGQISSASTMLRGPEGGLNVESAPVTGLMRTHAGNVLVTDSAASATAMATGFKVPKKAISVLADGRIPMTLFESARASGMSTGVVTTSGLVDATPAGFVAHAEKREHYSEILEDMLASGTDILVGGDWRHHRKANRDSAFQERLSRIDALGAAAGYTVVRDASSLAAAGGRVLALFPPRARGGDAHGPALNEVVPLVLDRLSTADRGFVLLVESEVTDGTGHENDIVSLVEGIRELDATLETVLDWSLPRGDTLVILTADHDTGGLAVVDGDYDRGVATVRWVTKYHTAQWVPVFAFGPGAGHFNGVFDNADLGVVTAKLLGIEDFPAVHP